MESWIQVAETFGIPLMLLFGAVYGIVKMFNWLANDLTAQIKRNNERIESIVIKLIENSKEEREETHKNAEKILNRVDTLANIIVKLSGNGLERSFK